MFRRQNHIGHAESRIGTGRKDRQLFIAEFKIKLSAFGTSDPVNLLRLDSLDKINVIQIFNQPVGIFGDCNHPLFFVFADDFGAAAFAAAVDDFFVSQAGFAVRTPVNGDFIFISQPFFKEFYKHPLRPFIIFGLGRINAAIPVKTKTDRLQLTGKIGNIFLCRNRRMHPGFNRIIFRRQAESVKSHRIQNIQAFHAFFAGNYVQSGIRTRMPDMQPRPRRIGKFDQRIKLFFILVDFDFIGFFIFPDFLPFFFNAAEIITVFQFPFCGPFFKTVFAVVPAVDIICHLLCTCC